MSDMGQKIKEYRTEYQVCLETAFCKTGSGLILRKRDDIIRKA